MRMTHNLHYSRFVAYMSMLTACSHLLTIRYVNQQSFMFYQDQIFSRNKTLSEKIGPEDRIQVPIQVSGPKFSKKLVQEPKFSGPKFQ